jgi:hypothetical protein
MPAFEYKRGDARTDALPPSAPSDDPTDETSEELPDGPALFELSTDQYWEWLSTLVEQGAALDQELDLLLDQIYDCDVPFYSVSGRRRLQGLLNDLHEARAAVRAYEYDVEELTYVFARTEAMETRAAENADMALSQIKETYNRAYDLCLYKLDRMGDGWITASNFLISVVMLVVTILFWMEFR